MALDVSTGSEVDAGGATLRLPRAPGALRVETGSWAGRSRTDSASTRHGTLYDRTPDNLQLGCVLDPHPPPRVAQLPAAR